MSEQPPTNTPTPGQTTRHLLRAARTATLATALAGSGWPYGSLVLVATLPDAAPVLLMSTLAEHVRNIAGDDRVSLLVDGTQDLASPLTGARATLLGRVAKTTDPGARARFLARHPDAEGYADFRDFSFYRLNVERAHLVAGFGRITWIEAGDILAPVSSAIAEAEADILAHMNDDHGEAIDLFATRLLGASGSGWRMCGCDAEGCDLMREGRLLRLDFARPLAGLDEVRQEMARLAKAARAA